MTSSSRTICVPDLSARPFGLTVQRELPFSPPALYEAPGSVLMRAEVNATFFFETVHRRLEG